MKEEARAAFIQSNSIAAAIESMGMQAENASREDQGLALAYGDEMFFELVRRYRLHPFEVRTFLETGFYPPPSCPEIGAQEIPSSERAPAETIVWCEKAAADQDGEKVFAANERRFCCAQWWECPLRERESA